MILVFTIVFCAIIALGFGAASAWSDISQMKIPNLYVVGVALSFIPAFAVVTLLAPDVAFFASWKSHLIAATLTFGITYILFTFNLVGGGDSKLLSAYALWVGTNGLMPLLFGMAVIGGLLGLVTLLLAKWQPVEKPTYGSWIAKSQKGEQKVPYGVAIFLGAVLTFWQIDYLNPEVIIALAETNLG